MPSKLVGRDAVLFVYLYSIWSHLIPSYFQITLAFSCFVLQLHLILNV